MSLSYPTDNAGRGTLSRTTDSDGWSSARVSVRALSALANEIDLSKVRLVKIDVEGHELDVLRGASQWLSVTPPTAIIFESNGETNNCDHVFSLLLELGYRLYSIPKRFFALQLTPCIDQTRAEKSHDILAVHRDFEQDVISRFAS